MFIITTRRQILQKLVILFATVLMIGLGGQAIFTTAGVDEDQPLTRAQSPDDRVALTFDVTWGRTELGKILSTLDAGGVKATFFVGGSFLSFYADSVKEMATRGHEIGTLGQKVIDLSDLPESEVASNLLASQSALTKLLGGPVRYFRPPQGKATPAVVRGARQANLLTVTSSLNADDQSGRKADVIARRVVQKAQRGDVILLCASDYAPETSKALPLILKGLKERGFKVVRLSELAPVTP